MSAQSSQPFVRTIYRERSRALAAMVFLGFLCSACDPDDPCRGDYIHNSRYAVCLPLPPDGGTAEEDQGPAPEEDPSAEDGDPTAERENGDEIPFGTTCATDDDCGGSAPYCVNEPIVLGCTNVLCGAGEANAGICPGDWTCVPAMGTNPSACVQF